MNQKSPVPRLDLAPKLKRPLSLWNPLDYLRLLYWVFYFPQALRWYVDTFGGGYIFLQELILLSILSFWLYFPRSLTQSLTVSLPGTMIFVMVFVTTRKVTRAVVFGITFATVVNTVVLMIRMFDEKGDVVLTVLGVMVLGLVFGVVFSINEGIKFCPKEDVIGSVKGGVALSMVFGIAFGVMLDLTGGLLGGVAFGVVFGAAFGVAILRLDNWLIILLFNLCNSYTSIFLIPRVTPLPILYLTVRLHNWLQNDWEAGLHNINQLLAYTMQFTPVIQAVDKTLTNTPPDQIIWRVSRLAEAPFNWKLLLFIFIPNTTILFSAKLDSEIIFKTKAHAATAGFWLLYEKQPFLARYTFTVVRSLLYGEEMHTLAQTLAIFYKAKEITTIAAIKPPSLPYQGSDAKGLLRPNTWQAIASLHRVIEDTQLVQHSISRATRAFALNHAQGELTNILNHPEILPEAERGLIIEIAQNWQQALLQVAGEVGEISITKPVRNPYITGDPVLGQRFVGREDVMRELEELWLTSESLQSVVLYGHRRMGKTSILRNATNLVGSGVQVAYVNMLNAGNISQGVGEVLMAICDVISETVNLPPPNDTDLLNLPYRTFERYLKQVVETLNLETRNYLFQRSFANASLQGLIIALDEFEKIEELIAAEKIPSDFMGYLRGLVQMYPQVAFAFAGLHTLEEMTADYFEPFFASVIPIHVGFMQRGATRQILANPIEARNSLNVETRNFSSLQETSEDFPLDYTPEALDHIYHLTHGQAYLVQLVGFQLVRRYNDQVFEMGHSRDPVFTVNDVEAVVNPEFFKRGRYYFDGVWSQAAQGAANQQTILQALAPHTQGLSLQELIETTGINYQDIQHSLRTLERHDVVNQHEGHWRIVVELFRRWVVQNR